MTALRLTVRRLAAYAVDVLLLAITLLPLAFLLGAVVGTDVATGAGVWLRSLLTISVPAWAYFILTDHLAGGRSLGKRLLRLRTRASVGGAPGWGASILRTAAKLLPWELVHLAFFGLAARLGEFGGVQVWVAMLSYALMGAYILVALLNGGRRSLPDFVAATHVEPVEGH